MNNTLLYLVELLISAGVAFILVWFIWHEEKPEEAKAETAPEAAPSAPELTVPTVSVIRCAAGQILQACPVRF